MWFDVKYAFLHEEISKVVYVVQPQCFEIHDREHMVYKLHKALYGLKQVPKAWFNRIKAYFIKEAFKRRESEETLFTKQCNDGTILIACMLMILSI